jgi:ABC-type multidrug transport system ATPase subunit
MANAGLRIQNLSKRYGNGVQALQDVSLTIGAGMFGLLGPNGAGKSTLMRIVATLQEADSGAVPALLQASRRVGTRPARVRAPRA